MQPYLPAILHYEERRQEVGCHANLVDDIRDRHDCMEQKATVHRTSTPKQNLAVQTFLRFYNRAKNRRKTEAFVA